MDAGENHADFVGKRNIGKMQDLHDEVSCSTTSDDSDSDSDYPLAHLVALRRQVEEMREIRKNVKQSTCMASKDEDELLAPIHNGYIPVEPSLTPPKRATACKARALINDIVSSDKNLDDSDNDPDYVGEKARDSSSDNGVTVFDFVRDSTLNPSCSLLSESQIIEQDNINSEQCVSSQNDYDKNNSEREKGCTLTRKRQSNPNVWKKNTRKYKRARGIEYTDSTGKQRNERHPKASGCEIKNCRYKCHENFSEQDRNDICKQYWSLADDSRQKDYLLATTKMIPIQRRRGRRENPRNCENTVHYFFNVGAAKFRVCKDFYLKTLDISSGPLRSAMDKKSEVNTFIGEDMRGKHEPHNKSSEESIKYVNEHIEQFPQTEAHYVRKNSQRKYLDQTLSINKNV